MKRIQKKFQSIREIFWPLLEEKKENKIKKIKLNDIKINKNNLKLAYTLAQKCFEEEEERNKTIESKSTIFIGILSVAITVLIAFSKFWEVDTTNIYLKLISIFAVVVLFIFLAYAISSIYYAYKVLQRRGFHFIEYPDFIKLGNEEDYLREIIKVYINITKQNGILVNEKVDYMTMSQEYFIRSVIMIFPIAVVLFVKNIF